MIEEGRDSLSNFAQRVVGQLDRIEDLLEAILRELRNESSSGT